MADQDLPEIYIANPVTVMPGDLLYGTVDTGTTPADGAFKAGQLMFNRYKISVAISANDLVVSLLHENGDTPSTDKPLYFKIGNSLRAVTAALSVTAADGTNWADLGSATLGTIEQDLFVYLIWNTGPATDIVD